MSARQFCRGLLKRSLKSSIHGDQSGTDEPSGKENITSDERTACVLNG